MEDKYELTAKIFKAFCDENRLKILESLKTGEKCACTLLEELEIVQSTLSHHMKILLNSGLVTGRKDGKWIYYALSDEGIIAAQNAMTDFTNKAEDYGTYYHCPVE